MIGLLFKKRFFSSSYTCQPKQSRDKPGHHLKKMLAEMIPSMSANNHLHHSHYHHHRNKQHRQTFDDADDDHHPRHHLGQPSLMRTSIENCKSSPNLDKLSTESSGIDHQMNLCGIRFKSPSLLNIVDSIDNVRLCVDDDPRSFKSSSSSNIMVDLKIPSLTQELITRCHRPISQPCDHLNDDEYQQISTLLLKYFSQPKLPTIEIMMLDNDFPMIPEDYSDEDPSTWPSNWRSQAPMMILEPENYLANRPTLNEYQRKLIRKISLKYKPLFHYYHRQINVATVTPFIQPTSNLVNGVPNVVFDEFCDHKAQNLTPPNKPSNENYDNPVKYDDDARESDNVASFLKAEHPHHHHSSSLNHPSSLFLDSINNIDNHGGDDDDDDVRHKPDKQIHSNNSANNHNNKNNIQIAKNYHHDESNNMIGCLNAEKNQQQQAIAPPKQVDSDRSHSIHNTDEGCAKLKRGSLSIENENSHHASANNNHHHHHNGSLALQFSKWSAKMKDYWRKN